MLQRPFENQQLKYNCAGSTPLIFLRKVTSSVNSEKAQIHCWQLLQTAVPTNLYAGRLVNYVLPLTWLNYSELTCQAFNQLQRQQGQMLFLRENDKGGESVLSCHSMLCQTKRSVLKGIIQKDKKTSGFYALLKVWFYTQGL